jgi:hypothetical protein
METPIVVSLGFAVVPLEPELLFPAPPPPQAASDNARTAPAAVKPSFLLTFDLLFEMSAATRPGRPGAGPRNCEQSQCER